MTAIQTSLFGDPEPATVPSVAPARPRRIIRNGLLSKLTAAPSRRRDLHGTHSASAALKTAFIRGDELTPWDALVRFGMQANSFHRAMFHIKKEGIAIIKIDHRRNGKIYHSYKMDKENSIGRAG
jgi:hypothetical protein